MYKSFKGSLMPAPAFESGQSLVVAGRKAVVQHRRYYSGNWHYGLIMEGWPGIYWHRE